MKPKAYIVDVDGTLADVSLIKHHLENGKRDFDSFHKDSISVPPYPHVVDMVNKAKKDGYFILTVTARFDTYRELTNEWLNKHNIPSDGLFMRGKEDWRKDYEVKKEILEMISNDWDVVHAIDDNPDVIKMWEENNIPTTRIEVLDGL